MRRIVIFFVGIFIFLTSLAVADSIELVFVKGGCYDMGDTFGDGEADEKPVHNVCVSDFYMGRYEVTRAQWEAFMPNRSTSPCYHCPMIDISWNDAQDFIKELNRRTGKSYRLPTEAEWEYAARSGGKKEKYAGTSSDSDLGSYAWYKSNSGDKTHPVGEKRPNGLGLYDMSGNLMEWVQDWYGKDYYSSSPRDNATGPSSGSGRVLRGGAWYGGPRGVRASDRWSQSPSDRSFDIGLRVVSSSAVAEQQATVSPEPPSIELVSVKGGCYDMGDAYGDSLSDDKPVHNVCVSDFHMGKYEVTQGQWKAIMGSNPSDFSSCGDACPVEMVSWNSIQDFIQKLNRRTGKSYRLPTEAEWEYAARSGGKKEKYAGTSSDSDLGNYAWYKSNSGDKTHRVGEKRPNGLGLYDMSGNVWEWVQDRQAQDYYSSSFRDNPAGPSSGSGRVKRGGSFGNDNPQFMRASFRWSDYSSAKDEISGFRIVLSSVAEEQRKSAARVEEELRIDLISVKGGCFDMGDTFGDGEADEKPVHNVCVSDFYMGKHEVTVGQFKKFVEATSYRTDAEKGDGCSVWTGNKWEHNKDRNWRNPGFSQDDRHPVVCVSWNDASAYNKWFSGKANRTYRLPTEAEWEYAARSGGKKEKYAGFSNESYLDTRAWYASNSRIGTHPVGEKRANGLRIYDMTGNVWEWTNDWYGDKYYSQSTKNNPQGPSSEQYREFRGGGWGNGPRDVRASNRDGGGPSHRSFSLGFRLVSPSR